jgi:group I intron endonuclease
MAYQIYLFQNKINNKIYIGQTVNFKRRLKKHIKNANENRKNSHFYSALKKYGIDQFDYFIIEELSSKKEMDDAEIFWIEYFRSWDREIGYNLTFGGEGCIPTTETREKMRQAKLGKSNPKMQGANHPFFGIKGEQHHRFGVPHTNEAKKKIAAANVDREYPQGSDLYNSKVNEEDVLYMREYFTNHQEYKTKDVFIYLANLFNIDEGTVESIVYNFSWKHVKMFPILNKNRKITTENVIDIRREMSNATDKVIKRKELANKYGVSYNTIYEIETYRRRKNVK